MSPCHFPCPVPSPKAPPPSPVHPFQPGAGGWRAAPQPHPRARTRGVAVEMVIPVYNEEHVLAASVATLHEHMVGELTFPFRITIADNASVDATPAVGRRLSGSSSTSATCDSSERAAGSRCGPPGAPAKPRSWHTWTSTSRRT